MKTAEEMREECAKAAEDLERRWRSSAAKLGPNSKHAISINAAANGLQAVAKVIRSLPAE